MLKAVTIHSADSMKFSERLNEFLTNNNIEYGHIQDIQFKATSTTLTGDFCTRAYTDYVALILYETND